MAAVNSRKLKSKKLLLLLIVDRNLARKFKKVILYTKLQESEHRKFDCNLTFKYTSYNGLGSIKL